MLHKCERYQLPGAVLGAGALLGGFLEEGAWRGSLPALTVLLPSMGLAAGQAGGRLGTHLRLTYWDVNTRGKSPPEDPQQTWDRTGVSLTRGGDGPVGGSGGDLLPPGTATRRAGAWTCAVCLYSRVPGPSVGASGRMSREGRALRPRKAGRPDGHLEMSQLFEIKKTILFLLLSSDPTRQVTLKMTHISFFKESAPLRSLYTAIFRRSAPRTWPQDPLAGVGS